jgi:actin-like ATPase involved in cell morphogenesis
VATLLGAQLRDVVARATEREGGPPERIVLAHPTTWTPTRRGRYADAARAAGLESPLLVTDAEAAVHHVAGQNLSGQHAAPGRVRDGGIVAVYDLGGGGFEATVVRVEPGGPEILGTPEGTDVLGGTDIDEAILSYVDDAVGGALARLDADDARTAVALARLRQDCVLAKETLSLDTETVVPVFLPGRQFEIRLNRTTFEQMLRALLGSTLDALNHAVRSAGLAAADVDAVLLVGGSTRIPLVAELLTREFGRPLLEGVHPVHAVALGAAALAGAPGVPAGVGAVSAAGAGPWATPGAALLDRPAAPVAAEPGADGATTAVDAPVEARDGDPEGATTVVDLPEAPTEFLQLPRLDPPGPDARPAAWPAPAGGPAFPPSPASHGPSGAPPAPPAAPKSGSRAGAAAMAVGAALAVLVLVLVFVLAP